MDTNRQRSEYQSAARQINRRLAWLRFASGIRRSHFIAGLFALVTIILLRRIAEWRSDEAWVAGGIILAWILGVTGFAVFRRSHTGKTLLFLDRKGGWKDCFSSAWEFLHVPVQSEAQMLHLERARAALGEAVRTFSPVLPLPSLRGAWVVPVLAILFACTPWLRIPPDSRDLELTDGMKDAAALQADELRRAAERINDIGSLNEVEKKELEALRTEVQSTSEKLANADGLTAGEMLESLEGRAQTAERLAEKLGLFSDAWASAEMLEEMSQHPDTADLSLLIKDKSAESAAVEATRLHEVLEDETIASDTEERMTRSLEKIMTRATDEDLTKPVGERFGNASLKMLSDQTTTAAREFEELAKHFREIAGREAGKKKLEQLAESLREAGGEITGSELQKMEAIAETSVTGATSPQGLKPLNSDSPIAHPDGLAMPKGADGTSPSLAKALTPAGKMGAEQKVPIPGSAPGSGEEGEEGGQTEKGQELSSAPVPGESSPAGKSGIGMSNEAQDGKEKGGMLSAPVPGMEPGQATPGAGMSLGGGTSSQSGQGGDQAGTGTAELVDQKTETLKATGEAEVVARTGKEGESTIRSVEGEAKAENASRSRQEVIADFIAVEEQALDDQSLPQSRRQHVLRYFSAIRDQFEKVEKE